MNKSIFYYFPFFLCTLCIASTEQTDINAILSGAFLNPPKICVKPKTSILGISFKMLVIGDLDIVNNIQSHIAQDNVISHLKLDIRCNKGDVQLTGIANSDQAERLIEICKATEGVHDVDASKLILKNNASLTKDDVITAKVKGVFIREKLRNDKYNHLEVETKNGVVTIYGKLENEDNLKKAIEVAKEIKGVNKVNPQLIVIESP